MKSRIKPIDFKPKMWSELFRVLWEGCKEGIPFIIGLFVVVIFGILSLIGWLDPDGLVSIISELFHEKSVVWIFSMAFFSGVGLLMKSIKK